MKDLKQILTTALMLGVLSVSALATGVDAQRREDKNPPPPKNTKEVPKEPKREQPQPRNDGGNHNRDNKGRDDRRQRP